MCPGSSGPSPPPAAGSPRSRRTWRTRPRRRPRSPRSRPRSAGHRPRPVALRVGRLRPADDVRRELRPAHGRQRPRDVAARARVRAAPSGAARGWAGRRADERPHGRQPPVRREQGRDGPESSSRPPASSPTSASPRTWSTPVPPRRGGWTRRPSRRSSPGRHSAGSGGPRTAALVPRLVRSVVGGARPPAAGSTARDPRTGDGGRSGSGAADPRHGGPRPGRPCDRPLDPAPCAAGTDAGTIRGMSAASGQPVVDPARRRGVRPRRRRPACAACSTPTRSPRPQAAIEEVLARPSAAGARGERGRRPGPVLRGLLPLGRRARHRAARDATPGCRRSPRRCCGTPRSGSTTTTCWSRRAARRSARRGTRTSRTTTSPAAGSARGSRSTRCRRPAASSSSPARTAARG